MNQFDVAFAVQLPFGVGSPVILKKFSGVRFTTYGSMNRSAKRQTLKHRNRMIVLGSIGMNTLFNISTDKWTQFQLSYFIINLQSMTTLLRSYDVVVSGAGPVGSIACLALSKCQALKNILMIEKQKPTFALSEVPNQRVYSINPASLRIFQSLGVFPDEHRRGLINRIRVFKNNSQVSFQQPFMSQVMENDSILHSIQEQIDTEDKITTLYNQEIESFETTNSCVQIKLKSGSSIQSKLLVGSDGNKSKVKELGKIRSYGWSYNQMGIVCTLKLANPITTAYQKYYHKNVLALLPLWDNYASIVWSAETPLYNYLIKLPNEEFKKELSEEMREFEGIKLEEVVNKPLSFPLSTIQSERYISDRIALIGDAAHSIHPMAGLGVNSGFADAALLANNVFKNIRTGNDIGQQIALKGYENEAKKLNYSNSVAMESIKKGFQTENPVLSFIRDQTINILNRSQTVKGILISGAKTNPFFPSSFEWEM